MIIQTSDKTAIKPFVQNIYMPPPQSHKGHNGKVLIIGGSKLFHSASLWAAEIATHFTDIVHYASTKENNAIFHDLKTKFRNGMVVEQKDIPYYVEEDDAILLGPGMVRTEVKSEKFKEKSFDSLLNLEDEAEYSREITHYLLSHYPQKRFVIDAGALQMMDIDWLKLPQETPIITPHQLEFERLFGVSLLDVSEEEKVQKVTEYARKYNCVILLKAVVDYISDGARVAVVKGGNQGLTKGGSGDILAGVTVSLRAKNDAFESAVIASYVEKMAADELSKTDGYWYNMEDLIHQIPKTFSQLVGQSVSRSVG
ncbi:MAG: NAD(P)H-hydrate dehydratase [Candidatus Pacebacteria bacterium]|nr:NAD(P)H-hydrate dehydratase [Candidatus Paceibacterota bacterium]